MTTLSNEQLREKIEHYLVSTQQDGAGIALGLKSTDGTPYRSRIVEFTDGIMDLLASQRQAILKEVREGAVMTYWDEFKNDFVEAVPIAHLDAIEKKYKGGEETPKEKR